MRKTAAVNETAERRPKQSRGLGNKAGDSNFEWTNT